LSVLYSAVTKLPYALNLVAEIFMLLRVLVTATGAPTLIFLFESISNLVIASYCTT
jgi:hypothetical protein